MDVDGDGGRSPGAALPPWTPPPGPCPRLRPLGGDGGTAMPALPGARGSKIPPHFNPKPAVRGGRHESSVLC